MRFLGVILLFLPFLFIFALVAFGAFNAAAFFAHDCN